MLWGISEYNGGIAMKIQFTTGGAAFGSEYETDEANSIYKGQEIIRILQKIIRQVEDGYEDGAIMDINGNKIGKWEI